MNTIGEILAYGKEQLKIAEVPNYNYDAEELLSECLNIPRLRLLLQKNEAVPEPLKIQYLNFISNRKKRIPLQHILGKAYFYGLEFYVNNHVLIPRQETEILCKEAINIIADKHMDVLDLCTGSGCIAITIATHCKNAFVSAIDISQEALQIAQQNSDIHHQTVRFIQNDLLYNHSPMYDMILSNPPYIPRADLHALQEEVRYDPLLALDGGLDGFDFLKTIIRQSKLNLKKDGILIMEMGYNQYDTLATQMTDFYDIRPIKDLNNINRFIFGRIK